MGRTEDVPDPKESLDRHYDLQFRNLRCTVPSKRSDKPASVILKSISGACRGCRLTAIMGASGAGELCNDDKIGLANLQSTCRSGRRTPLLLVFHSSLPAPLKELVTWLCRQDDSGKYLEPPPHLILPPMRSLWAVTLDRMPDESR